MQSFTAKEAGLELNKNVNRWQWASCRRRPRHRRKEIVAAAAAAAKEILQKASLFNPSVCLRAPLHRQWTKRPFFFKTFIFDHMYSREIMNSHTL
jgi:hypothetical protein